MVQDAPESYDPQLLDKLTPVATMIGRADAEFDDGFIVGFDGGSIEVNLLLDHLDSQSVRLRAILDQLAEVGVHVDEVH